MGRASVSGSGSTGWFDALFDGDPALLAGIMGAVLVIVGLVFAFRLASAASGELARTGDGSRPASFDDAWWALRHAAYFCLAIISLGVLLLLGPALGSIGDGSSASPSSSPEAAATNAEKPDKADKPGHGDRENRGDHGDEDDDADDE